MTTLATLGLRASQWLRSTQRSQAIILAYHRVSSPATDPQLLSVTPEHFAEHLAVLSAECIPTRLPALTQSLKNNALPSRTVVVTFDDGYADNLYNAKPLLERHDIPATVFVTTSYVGSNRQFWWDELAGLLLEPGTLPQTLPDAIKETISDWSAVAQYTEAESKQYRRWNVELAEPTPRHEVYRALCQRLRPLPENERRKVLDEILLWAGTGSRTLSTIHRVLSIEELARLEEGGLIEVGSHSATHPVLSTLSIDDQRVEIAQSKAYLDEVLGRPTASFAYPFGARTDYTRATVSLIKEARYNQACANFPSPIRSISQSFELPRILVRDCDGEEFARFLRHWLRP
jgi:peptidoglycan/xylan/chitin deacetylase (PgdA/CDA1 family)